VLRMDLQPGAAQAVCGRERRDLEAFRGAPVHAVAGIGNPQRFFRDLRARASRSSSIPFPTTGRSGPPTLISATLEQCS